MKKLNKEVVDILLKAGWKKSNIHPIKLQCSEGVLGLLDIEVPKYKVFPDTITISPRYINCELIRKTEIRGVTWGKAKKTYFVLDTMTLHDLLNVSVDVVNILCNKYDMSYDDNVFVGINGKYLIKLQESVFGDYDKRRTIYVGYYTQGLTILLLKSNKLGWMFFAYPIVAGEISDDAIDELEKFGEHEVWIGGKAVSYFIKI